jgi:hypothetical protein
MPPLMLASPKSSGFAAGAESEPDRKKENRQSHARTLHRLTPAHFDSVAQLALHGRAEL